MFALVAPRFAFRNIRLLVCLCVYFTVVMPCAAQKGDTLLEVNIKAPKVVGNPIIANVTGGMQDQMRFEFEDGTWINFDADFPSNHRGTIKKHNQRLYMIDQLHYYMNALNNKIILIIY